MSSNSYVKKRDGRMEIISFDKILQRLRKLAMDQNKRLGEVARDLMAYARLLKELKE